jgi:hypothetical protein
MRAPIIQGVRLESDEKGRYRPPCAHPEVLLAIARLLHYDEALLSAHVSLCMRADLEKERVYDNPGHFC